MTSRRTSRPRRLVAAAAVATALGLGLDHGGTAAAAVTVRRTMSQNWAGYVDTGTTFSSVSGAWRVPRAKRSADGYSATWVGLGGATSDSQALEQVGTESDSAGGQTTYRAWYEILPAPAKRLAITVRPGDRMSARVTVRGTTVSITLSDLTTGRSATKTLHVAHPDTSSAEWIVEAPSAVTGYGATTQLPLADFGKVTFTAASATAAGHTGAITDSSWNTERVRMASPADRRFGGAPRGFPGSAPGAAGGSWTRATTSALSSAASSFTVTRGAQRFGTR